MRSAQMLKNPFNHRSDIPSICFGDKEDSPGFNIDLVKMLNQNISKANDALQAVYEEEEASIR